VRHRNTRKQRDLGWLEQNVMRMSCHTKVDLLAFAKCDASRDELSMQKDEEARHRSDLKDKELIC
jgi:hypothetical protein